MGKDEINDIKIKTKSQTLLLLGFGGLGIGSSLGLDSGLVISGTLGGLLAELKGNTRHFLSLGLGTLVRAQLALGQSQSALIQVVAAEINQTALIGSKANHLASHFLDELERRRIKCEKSREEPRTPMCKLYSTLGTTNRVTPSHH